MVSDAPISSGQGPLPPVFFAAAIALMVASHLMLPVAQLVVSRGVQAVQPSSSPG
jgi:hypothetical protein